MHTYTHIYIYTYMLEKPSKLCCFSKDERMFNRMIVTLNPAPDLQVRVTVRAISGFRGLGV